MSLSHGQVGFSHAQLVELLGNRLASAAVKGKSLPVLERVYERLTAQKV